MSPDASAPPTLEDITARYAAMKPALRDAKGRLGPGNPGRPRGAKDSKPRKKRVNITQDILRDFHKNHAAFLAAYREKNPDGYLDLIAEHLPGKS